MAISKVKNENFIVIQGWMINELKLKGNELLVYALIYGFSQEENMWFNGTLQYIIDWTSLSKKSVITTLSTLVSKNYIEKKETIINNVKFCSYKCIEISSLLKKLHHPSEKNTPPIDNIEDNIDINNNIYINNIKEKEIYKEKENPIFKQKEVEFEIVESEEPIMITDEEQIFNHWNSKEIVKHRELTKPLKDEIKKKIKELGFDNIILGIDHYAEILQDKKYFFNYAWSLLDFLKRKNGITNFLEEGSQWQSYVKQSSKFKNKRDEEALENWAKKDYQGTTLF